MSGLCLYIKTMYFLKESEMKIKVELGDIQKTLFMPVWARAVETIKENPLLIDKTAVEIIRSVDFDFDKMYHNFPEISQISWIARCKRFDLIVNDFICRYPGATIVNIGCGLDTSYERINNKSIFWYDLDLPDVIDLKRKFIDETENRKFLACSFFDTHWFDEIRINEKVMFISAGVFVYFEELKIKDFFIRLADRFKDFEMFFDVTSPKGVEIANQMILKSGINSDSFFKWGLKDKGQITSWDNRIHLFNTYYTYRIDGLELSMENQEIAAISDSLDIQYMIHLKVS